MFSFLYLHHQDTKNTRIKERLLIEYSISQSLVLFASWRLKVNFAFFAFDTDAYGVFHKFGDFGFFA
jgi:hypothetical protein